MAKVARVARWPGPAARVPSRRDDGYGDGWTAAHDAADRASDHRHDDAARGKRGAQRGFPYGKAGEKDMEAMSGKGARRT